MIWVYIASAVFGGAFVIPMMLGGLDLDAEVGDVYMDVGDIDMDMDLDMDVASASFTTYTRSSR